MTPVTSHPVLMLNAAFEPVHICTVRRAMTLIAKGNAIVMERSKHVIRTSSVSFPLPSVIRLLHYRHVPRYVRAVSKKSIFLRDDYRCQYCLVHGTAATLTLDHVIPKSKGGKIEWGNAVSACFPCNNKKGSMTPDEAGMPLARKPLPFSLHAKHKQAGAANPEWDKFLFY